MNVNKVNAGNNTMERLFDNIEVVADDEVFRQYLDTKYYVSNYGRVVSTSQRRKLPHILNEWPDKDGYMKVTIYSDPIHKHSSYVHRLVAYCFIGERHDGLHIDHIDCNRTNNHISNLRYVKPRENSRNRLNYKGNITKTKYGKFIGRVSNKTNRGDGKEIQRHFDTEEEAKYFVKQFDEDPSLFNLYGSNQLPKYYGNIIQIPSGNYRHMFKMKGYKTTGTSPTHRQAHDEINKLRVKFGMEPIAYEERVRLEELKRTTK